MISSESRIKVLHCITSLHGDGAQNMLLKLCAASKLDRFAFSVISLAHPSGLEDRFRRLGVPVKNIGMSPSLPTPAALLRLARSIDAFGPDVIQGWMWHANLAAYLGALFSGQNRRVVWNMRRGLRSDADRAATRGVIRLNALLAGRVQRIVYCGSAIAKEHEEFGFPPGKTRVIPNGFDLAVFYPSEDNRARLRAQLGLGPSAVLVGAAGRYHPQKDYPTLLAAVRIVSRMHPEAYFALAGRDVEPGNAALTALIRRNEVQDRVFLLGPRSDMPQLISSLDIFCSSSDVEGFSNVVGEAMASAVPCVATDAGAAHDLVGDAGLVVPRRSPEQLAAGLAQLIALAPDRRLDLGRRARERISRLFSIEKIAAEYQRLYEEVAWSPASQAASETQESSASI